jgi:hypothetical protein
VDSDRSKEKDSHHGRDAAVVGGVGAGAGAATYGAHKYNERDDKLAQKEHEKQVHDAEKQRAHDQKIHDKQVHDAEKQRAHAATEHAKNDKHDDKHDKHDDKHEKKEHKGLFSFLRKYLWNFSFSLMLTVW